MTARRRKKLHLFFYRLMFVVLGLSSLMLILSYYSASAWELYHSIYFFMLLGYTWYISFLLFIGEVSKDRFTRYKNEKIAVLMPVYNEDLFMLKQAIKSVIRAKGNKELFIIDDGSTKGYNRKELMRLCKQADVQVHFFKKNKGKRHALYHGVAKMITDHKFIVTVDSDTILDENALIRIVEPLKNPKIAASTGDIRLINETQNYLTRMVGAYYWIGLNIFKKAQSSLGMVVCCSGCLSAYRSDELKKIMKEFVNQEFLGQECTHSEDRHLTNLILRDGYQVKYVPAAISYTHTPYTIKSFLKQQQRWKRGYIRESTYTLTYAWRSRPLLFLQILLCELAIPFLAFGLMVSVTISLLINPLFFLNVILPSWLLFMCIRYIHIFFYAKRKVPGLLIYMIFYELCLYWQFIYALFTVRNKNWGTR